MPLARAVIGTLTGIPQALSEAEMDDLYEVAQVLQDTRNAVLEIALRRLSCAEGQRIAAEFHRRALSSSKEGGPAA